MSDISLRLPDFKGCRVAVFRNDVSGGTLGFYGTVLGKLCTGEYLVHVPAIEREVSVAVGDMLVFQTSSEGRRLVPLDSLQALCPGDWHFEIADVEDVKWPVGKRRWEIEFESTPEPDNAVLRGKYRIGALQKGRFEFQKSDLPMPTYLFRTPARMFGSSRGKLSFKVPTGDVLDRAYVMKSLAELLAQPLPIEDEFA